MNNIANHAGNAGALGSLLSAAACPACFPALASLGAALGIGSLAEYEGLFVTRLLPLFAGLALLAHGLGWWAHRQWRRSAFGMAGPALVLMAIGALFAGSPAAQPLLYSGLVLMVAASLWDLLARRRTTTCAAQACDGSGGACASR